MQKITIKYILSLEERVRNTFSQLNLYNMGNNSIEHHIRMMYPNWLQQSKRLCANLGKQQEAQDILQEVICDLLQRYPSKIQEWCKKQEINYKALDCMVINILRKNIYSHSAMCFQKYDKKRPPIDRNIDINEIQIADTPEINLLEIAEAALDKIKISPRQKEIFFHYYFQHKALSEWAGPESHSKLSRTCQRVILLLREEIKKYQ